MAEINEYTEENDISWVGFFTSLIAAPVMVSTALLVPFLALDTIYHSDDVRGLMAILIPLCIIGTIFYLVIGTPVLIWHLSTHAPKIHKIVKLSVLSVLAFLPVGGFFSLLAFDTSPLVLAAFCTGFGLIGAPPLAATFTLIYQRFLRN
jgi:hypothetical protein